MKRFTLISLALAVSGLAVAAQPKADLARGKQVAETVCASCHAADGNSGIPTYPRLAAQHAAYIATQAEAIRDKKRTTGNAKEMADDPNVAAMTNQDIVDAAAYFATRFPKSGETDPRFNPTLGAKIYRGGIPERNVPACMSCHGPSGAGMPNKYPRLAGQHSMYVQEALSDYANGTRQNVEMNDVAQKLTAEEMKAAANFIQGLH